ncbi:MAG: hypothetical protein MJE68_30255, partial [Proteobacteria bacterium]|nr:hypothetical protein [Pseudomonadota bacterium]
DEIQVVKDICNYVYDTYGRFPAFSDPMFLRFMVQAHHLDLDFYDKYYPPGAYTEAHKNHFARWHPDIPDPFSGSSAVPRVPSHNPSNDIILETF